jgi:hypothetical protein
MLNIYSDNMEESAFAARLLIILLLRLHFRVAVRGVTQRLKDSCTSATIEPPVDGSVPCGEF